MAEDYPDALAALDRLAALHAEKPGHVYFRAIVLDKTRDLKPALESYQRFLTMSNGQNPNEEFRRGNESKFSKESFADDDFAMALLLAFRRSSRR